MTVKQKSKKIYPISLLFQLRYDMMYEHYNIITTLPRL